MEIFIVSFKAIMIVYFVMASLQGSLYKFSQMAIIVPIILVYIIVNVLKEIIDDIRFKNGLIILSLVVIYLGFCLDIKLFIIFIPLSVVELFYFRISRAALILLFVIQTTLFRNNVFFTQFALFSLLSVFFYEILQRSFERISRLYMDNERLREKNQKLVMELESSEKHEQQMVYTSKLEERNKVAQEIHDKIGHTISGSAMQLEAAKMLLEVDKDKASVLIQKTIDVLREGMENIRSTLRSIKPPIEQVGINNLSLLLKKFSKNSGIKANLFYEGNLDIISINQWKIIYDNVGESLTNAMKYSEANNLVVRIQIFNKFVKTEVKDDGKGCDMYSKGLGLIGMEERTANANGKLIVDGSDGFSVITLLPIVKGRAV